MVEVDETFNAAANLPVILDFDAQVSFSTSDANSPSEAEVFELMEDLTGVFDYEFYIMNYVWSSEPEGTLFFDVQRVAFAARGGTVA